MTQEELAERLNYERNAWGFVLKLLKPLLREPSPNSLLTKENVLAYIHDFALKTYHQSIAFRLGVEI